MNVDNAGILVNAEPLVNNTHACRIFYEKARGRFFIMRESFACEVGSAVLEFVVLALPLLVPLAIYLTGVHANSRINSDLHNLARQSARAFITSPNDSFESARMQAVLSVFESKVFQPDGISEVPLVSVTCSQSPCLTPNARVRVTASLSHSEEHLSGIFRFLLVPSMQFSASDVQIVDAWR